MGKMFFPFGSNGNKNNGGSVKATLKDIIGKGDIKHYGDSKHRRTWGLLVLILMFLILIMLVLIYLASKPTPRGSRTMMPITRLEYRGTCMCPYDIDKQGNQCGKRSAYARSNGQKYECYE